MKIIFQSYNICCQNESGGVNTRIHQIAKKIMESGIEVEFFNPFLSDLRTADILHIFRLDYENYQLVRFAKNLGLKIVISSIVNLMDGTKIDFYRKLSNFPIPTTYKLMSKSLEMADLVIAETFAEKRFLIKHFKRKKDIVVIPNGIDRIEDGNGYRKKIFDEDFEYVLQVGRFDSNKNQINLIKAMKGTGIHVVFVGGAGSGFEEYYRKCAELATGEENFHFLGWVDNSSEKLESLYANARLLILPSYNETFGLVVLEAGRFGTETVISNTLPILEFAPFKDCISFSPDNPKEMREKIVMAYNRDRNYEYKESLLDTFSWDNIINSHIEHYKELVGNVDT